MDRRPPAHPGARIEVTGLTKHFGRVRAVDDLAFTVEPGAVTGFLGPNGAGKTTTLRMILGLAALTAGSATIGGERYARLRRPTRTVGAVLDASALHPGHTVRDHLRIHCALGGHPASRAAALLEELGLADLARRRTRALSTGLRQRLGLATALLGDPGTLILDEPGNGLDPEGRAWLRRFLRERAAEGRTVLVSSHLLSEMQQVVDDVVIIRGGRLVAAGPLHAIERHAPGGVLVTSPDAAALGAVLARHGEADVEQVSGTSLRVRGMAGAAVADAAAAAGLRVHGLTAEEPGLEDLFLRLTGERRPPAAAPEDRQAATAGAAAARAREEAR